MSTKQQKAQVIFDEGNVQQVNKDTFVCHGSNGNQYEIKRNKDSNYNYEFYCKCPAWKFDKSRECKHVIAVGMLLRSSPSMTNAQAQQAMNARVSRASQKTNGNSQYKVRKAKEKCEEEIDNLGKDGKSKPLRFDKNGKLIIQYTTKVIPKDDDDDLGEYE
jgi:uncharacterized Zn finger protein